MENQIEYNPDVFTHYKTLLETQECEARIDEQVISSLGLENLAIADALNEIKAKTPRGIELYYAWERTVKKFYPQFFESMATAVKIMKEMDKERK